jgi:hypothetical protein
MIAQVAHRHCLHGLSPEVKASFDGGLIRDNQV